jgi:DNA-directed RNA polymerase subunit K/omega
MTDTNEVLDVPVESDALAEPLPKAPPIESRFLFVDVAAMRAKQLRRGARPRLGEGGAGGEVHRMPRKAERIAMEEVRHGLVWYDTPAPPRSAGAA